MIQLSQVKATQFIQHLCGAIGNLPSENFTDWNDFFSCVETSLPK
jgi:hypothetical protein